MARTKGARNLAAKSEEEKRQQKAALDTIERTCSKCNKKGYSDPTRRTFYRTNTTKCIQCVSEEGKTSRHNEPKQRSRSVSNPNISSNSNSNPINTIEEDVIDNLRKQVGESVEKVDDMESTITSLKSEIQSLREEIKLKDETNRELITKIESYIREEAINKSIIQQQSSTIRSLNDNIKRLDDDMDTLFKYVKENVSGFLNNVPSRSEDIIDTTDVKTTKTRTRKTSKKNL